MPRSPPWRRRGRRRRARCWPPRRRAPSAAGRGRPGCRTRGPRRWRARRRCRGRWRRDRSEARTRSTASDPGRPTAGAPTALMTITPTSRAAHSASERLGVGAVDGIGPHPRVDREHHGVEVVAAQRLELGTGRAEVVAGDADEAGEPLVAGGEDDLGGRRALLEDVEARDAVELVEVEAVGAEAARASAPGGRGRRRGWSDRSCRRRTAGPAPRAMCAPTTTSAYP